MDDSPPHSPPGPNPPVPEPPPLRPAPRHREPETGGTVESSNPPLINSEPPPGKPRDVPGEEER